MRVVSGLAHIGCVLFAIVLSSQFGCVMPSRESLKEPGWQPTVGQVRTTRGDLKAGPLIKPFIPPENAGSGENIPVGMGTAPQIEPPVAARQGNLPTGTHPAGLHGQRARSARITSCAVARSISGSDSLCAAVCSAAIR